MKTRLLSLLGISALALAFVTPSASAQNTQALYEEGKAAFNAGKLEIAREKLNEVARTNPSHVPTQAMLAQINQALAANNNELRNAYQKVIIDKIEFDKVELGEALDAVRILARKASNEQVTPNVILTNPDLAKQLVSINLTQVPLTEVLNYLAQLAGARLTYDKNAVLLTVHTAG